MEKHSVFGELLYIGLVYEKGRCRSDGIWKLTYTKSLKRHIELLKRIAQCMQNEFNIEEDNIFLEKVCCEIQCDAELNGYYPLNKSLGKSDLDSYIITNCSNENKYDLIIKFIIKLLEDILYELNKGLRKNKEKICRMIFSAHNLPRVYLSKKNDTLCLLHQDGITFSEALEFSKLSMNEDMLSEYSPFFVDL